MNRLIASLAGFALLASPIVASAETTAAAPAAAPSAKVAHRHSHVKRVHVKKTAKASGRHIKHHSHRTPKHVKSSKS